MAFFISWRDDCAVVTFHGHITAPEVLAANERYYCDHRSEAVRCSIWDFTAITGIGQVSTADLEHYAALDFGASFSLRRQGVALVATTDEARAYCLQYQQICDSLGHGWVVEIFDSLDEALGWCSGAT
jgi:hypothetical protein